MQPLWRPVGLEMCQGEGKGVRRGIRGARRIRGTKGSFSVVLKRIFSWLIPCSLAADLFFRERVAGGESDGGRERGRRTERRWSADFKVIFNFKPCSLSQTKPPFPDTVLSMAPQRQPSSLAPSLSSHAFVTLAFKCPFSPAGWPSEGAPLRDMKETDFNYPAQSPLKTIPNGKQIPTLLPELFQACSISESVREARWLVKMRVWGTVTPRRQWRSLIGE